MKVEEALQMLAGVFEEPIGSLSPASRREDIVGWDSMGFLTLMAEFDDRFGIALTTAQLESLASIADVLQLMRDHDLLDN